MPLSDAQLLAHLNQRHARWVALLEAVRRDQLARTGRSVGPVHWIGSPNLGPWTWLGFFWEAERFWFGFGFTGKDWRLLVEAEARHPASRVWPLLRKQLPEVWNYNRQGDHLRLCLGSGQAQTTSAQRSWLQARSRELDEFAVGLER